MVIFVRPEAPSSGEIGHSSLRKNKVGYGVMVSDQPVIG